MAIKWSQVSQKPEFLALSPEEQEETRNLYFEDVVAPQVDPADLKLAREAFDEDTRPQPVEIPSFEPSTVGAIPVLGPALQAAGMMGVEPKEAAREYMPNVMKGAAERSGDLYANLARFIDKGGQGLSELTGMDVDALTQGDIEPGEPNIKLLERIAQGIEESADLGYEERTTWEDVKQNWWNLPSYAFEKGFVSLPDMAAAVGAPVPYILSRSYELADERAANLEMDEPSADMLLPSIPAAAALTLAERIGGQAALGIGKGATAGITGAIGKEAGTEFLQEGAEYAYGTVGTGKYDPLENLDRAFAGAAVGGPVGGAIRSTVETAKAVDKKFELAREMHETIPDPQRILQHSETATIQEREASMQSEATAQVTALEEELEVPAPEVEVEEIEAAPAPALDIELPKTKTPEDQVLATSIVKTAVKRRLARDEIAEGDAFRGTDLEELRTIAETGKLPVGKDAEGTPGISAVPLSKDPEVPFPAYGASGVGYVAPGGRTTDAGRAMEVLVDENTDPTELTYMIGDRALTFSELQEMFGIRPEVEEITAAPAPVETEALESPVTAPEPEEVPTHSDQEIARAKPRKSRLAAKYREIGGKRDPETRGYVFRSVDKKRVERAEKIFGESDVEAQPDVAGSFQTYIRDRGLADTKLERDEMKAVRSDYRTSLAAQRPQVQTGPSDLTTKDSSIDNMRYLFQDKFIDLKRIEEVAGPGRAKPYRAETLHSGRAAARVDDVETNVVDPLTTILADNKIDLQDLNDYMHALHAPEANAELERRNPLKEGQERDITALSGISNKDAADIVAKWEGNEGMQQAAQYIRDMNDATADIIEAEGLEPGDVVQTWRDMYKNYVPLHRAGKASLAGKGKGFSIRGRETKARVGSEDQVVDIIGHSVQNHARAIQRAEKNRVGLEVLNFARENPDPNFWKVDPIETTTRFNPETGLVETTADPTYQTKPNVFEVKEDGKTHHITFNENNPKAMRLAESLNGLDADQLGVGMRALRSINQYLSAVNTTYNPEFMLGNFFRDVQTAGIKMEATEVKGMQMEVAKALPEAMKTIYRSERGKAPTTDMHRYHEEWRQAGGKTGWVDAHVDVESRVKELQGIIKSKQTENKMRDVYKWTTGWMKDANSAVENAVRLSAYIAARKKGVSVEDAAVLSKELTVNFNRKGAWGPAANAAWLFYNASVQGSANVLGSMRSKRVQKLVTGMAVGAFANAFLQREIGGEDEDEVPYWDKISPYEKERNLIIMNPFDDEGDYFKIPLPYGYNVFKVFGEATADAIAREDYNTLDAAGQVVSSILGSFNPVGSDASFLQAIAPTVLDPAVQIGENKQFYGAPVMPENKYGVDRANSELYFRSARETSVNIAKAMNELTGGHKYKSGYVDLSPEWIDLMVDFLTGGAGRTVTDTAGTITDVLTGEIDERPLRRTPAVRKFYAASPETWTSQTYFDYKHDVAAFEAEAKDEAKGGKDLTRFESDPRAPLIPALKAVEKALRVAYKGRDRLEAAQPEGWEDKVKEVEDKIDWARKRFIVKYRAAIYPQDK